MKRIQHSTATGTLPAASESGTTGYFTKGDPAVPTPATVVTQEWANRVQEEICGTIEGAGLTLDGADNSQLAQAIALIAQAYATPTGAVQHYFGTTPPAGWVARNGTTLGNAGSGATGRANADTEALYTLIWNGTSNTGDFVIQDSAGSPTTRGASAAADFAALKRIPLPDDRGLFDRGLNTAGTGYDPSRTLASSQADGFKSHAHDVKMSAEGMRSPADYNRALHTTVATTPTGTTELEGGTETRPANRAYLPIIKL